MEGTISSESPVQQARGTHTETLTLAGIALAVTVIHL